MPLVVAVGERELVRQQLDELHEKYRLTGDDEVVSFYPPEEIVALAHDSGFADARYVPTADVAERYLNGRTDGLRASGGEGILLART